MLKLFLFQAIQFIQTVLIQTIQFSICRQFSSIDRALSGAIIPGQSGPESGGNKGVLCIPQSSSITGTSLSDCLVSYPGHLLGEGVLTLCRKAVSVFYSPSRLNKTTYWIRLIMLDRNTWNHLPVKKLLIKIKFLKPCNL